MSFKYNLLCYRPCSILPCRRLVLSRDVAGGVALSLQRLPHRCAHTVELLTFDAKPGSAIQGVSLHMLISACFFSIDVGDQEACLEA